MLELHHWEPNGSHLKPLILLYEKDLPFRSHFVDLLSSARGRLAEVSASAETRLNLEGEGPILVDEGRQITESLFMLHYLEDRFYESSFRPASAFDHARTLAWARFVNEVLMPAASTLGCHRYLVPALRKHHVDRDDAQGSVGLSYLSENWRLARTGAYPDGLLEDSRRKVAVSAARIEDALRQDAWLVGSAYSLADIDAFAVSTSLPVLTPEIVNETRTPRMVEWLRRVRERPAVQSALALSRTGTPERCFAPGPEHSRWG